MKKDSLNTVKSILNRVNKYRCCSLGAAAGAFERYEKKEEKAEKLKNREIR